MKPSLAYRVHVLLSLANATKLIKLTLSEREELLDVIRFYLNDTETQELRLAWMMSPSHGFTWTSQNVPADSLSRSDIIISSRVIRFITMSVFILFYFCFYF